MATRESEIILSSDDVLTPGFVGGNFAPFVPSVAVRHFGVMRDTLRCEIKDGLVTSKINK